MDKTREELVQEMAAKISNAELLHEVAIPGVVQHIDKCANETTVK